MRRRNKSTPSIVQLTVEDPIYLRKEQCDDPAIGYGLFTDQDLTVGEFICNYRGERLTAVEADKRKNNGFLFYFKHKEEDLCIDAFDISKSGIARYANDEWKNPNSKVVKLVIDGKPELFLKCIRPIGKGEEIRYDYNDKNAPWRKRSEKPLQGKLQQGKRKFGVVKALKEEVCIGTFPLFSTVCMFGRSKDCDIIVSQKHVADHHCHIEINKNGEAFLVENDAVKLLNNKDKIKVGSRMFIWEYDPESQSNKTESLVQDFHLVQRDSLDNIDCIPGSLSDISNAVDGLNPRDILEEANHISGYSWETTDTVANTSSTNDLDNIGFEGADYISETPSDHQEKITDTVDITNFSNGLDNIGLEGANNISETPCDDLEKTTDTVDNTNSTHDLDNIGLEGANNITETPCDDLEKITDPVDITNSTHGLDNIGLEGADSIAETPCDDLEKTTDTVDITNSTHDLDTNIRLEGADNISETPCDDLEKTTDTVDNTNSAHDLDNIGLEGADYISETPCDDLEKTTDTVDNTNSAHDLDNIGLEGAYNISETPCDDLEKTTDTVDNTNSAHDLDNIRLEGADYILETPSDHLEKTKDTVDDTNSTHDMDSIRLEGADISETPCDDLEKTTDTFDNANSTHDLDTNIGLEGAYNISETPCDDLEKTTDTVDNTNSAHDLDNIGLEGADNILETPCDDLEKTTDTFYNTNSTHDLDTNIGLEGAYNISETPCDDLEKTTDTVDNTNSAHDLDNIGLEGADYILETPSDHLEKTKDTVDDTNSTHDMDSIRLEGADISETPCDDLEKTTDTFDNANSTHDLDSSGLEGADILETPNDLEQTTDTVDNTNSTHDLDNIGLEGADNISETPCDDLEKTTDTVDNTISTHDLDNIRLERADNISENPDDDLEVISSDDDGQDPTYKPDTGNLIMDSDSESDGSYSDIYPALTETTVDNAVRSRLMSSFAGQTDDVQRETNEVNEEEAGTVQGMQIQGNMEDEEDTAKVQTKGRPDYGFKRKYDKINSCTFCKKLIRSKITRHLLTHKERGEILQIKMLPKKSVERDARFAALVNEGNYKHNIEVLRLRKGILITMRRESPDKAKHSVDEYFPCEFCKGFCLKRLLWHHIRNCKVKKFKTWNDGNYVRNSRTLLYSSLLKHEDKCIEPMLQRMHDGEIKDIVMKDSIIRKLSAIQIAALGDEMVQKKNDMHRVSQNARSLARLVKEARKEKPVIFLTALLKPENFDLLVRCVCRMASSSLTLAPRMGHLLGHCIMTKSGWAIRCSNSQMLKEANDFKILFDAEWGYVVNSAFRKKKHIRDLNKTVNIPETEDLVKLRRYLIGEMKEKTDLLRQDPNPSIFKWLAKVTMCRLLLFNKRRVAEVENLTVENYINRPHWKDSEEFEKALTVAEKQFAMRMDMVEGLGKSKKNQHAYILITPEAKMAIQELIAGREAVNISLKNKYLFARLNSDTPLSGVDSLKEVCEKCPDLQYPEKITTTSLRKYVATVSQILDMTSGELRLLAKHLGHDVKTHKEYYQLSAATQELSKVSRMLSAVEQGEINNWKDRPMSEIKLDDLPLPVPENSEDEISEPEELHPALEHGEMSDEAESSCEERPAAEVCPGLRRGVKRKWTQEENNIFIKYFATEIKNKEMPKGTKLQKCQKELNTRTMPQIRAKVHNVIKLKQKFKTN